MSEYDIAKRDRDLVKTLDINVYPWRDEVVVTLQTYMVLLKKVSEVRKVEHNVSNPHKEG